MTQLRDKVAIVTGGAGGIGLATAKLFVAEGARVLLVDIDEGGLKEAVATLGGQHASYCVADVSDETATKTYVETALERYGKIDVLFSNAGFEGRVLPLVDYPIDAFDKVIAVNVRGVYLSLQHTIPVMAKNGGGSIMITSSIAGLHGFAGLSAYVTSKHAVVGMMRSAVLEVTPLGIRINTIHPAPIETRMMRSIEEGAAPGAGAQAKTGFEAMIPARRYGEPEEVASLALFLASDASRYCSGGTYSVDGGMSVG